MNNPVIFGLIINPNRLIEIRESRMNFLQVKEASNYTDIKIVQDEYLQIKRICAQNDWKTIDVSQRSILVPAKQRTNMCAASLAHRRNSSNHYESLL